MSAAKTYVARPVQVEAVQWDGHFEQLPAAWRALDLLQLDVEDGSLIVRTPEGLAASRIGDYIVRGTVGEFYPVQRLVFENKYEVVG